LVLSQKIKVFIVIEDSLEQGVINLRSILSGIDRNGHDPVRVHKVVRDIEGNVGGKQGSIGGL
jgi:hypothetical protein